MMSLLFHLRADEEIHWPIVSLSYLLRQFMRGVVGQHGRPNKTPINVFFSCLSVSVMVFPTWPENRSRHVAAVCRQAPAAAAALSGQGFFSFSAWYWKLKQVGRRWLRLGLFPLSSSQLCSSSAYKTGVMQLQCVLSTSHRRKLPLCSDHSSDCPWTLLN